MDFFFEIMRHYGNIVDKSQEDLMDCRHDVLSRVPVGEGCCIIGHVGWYPSAASLSGALFVTITHHSYDAESKRRIQIVGRRTFFGAKETSRK